MAGLVLRPVRRCDRRRRRPRAELTVGDISKIDPNIYGGATYMDQPMTQYFPDATFAETNRALFAFAFYNADPGRIARKRRETKKRGLDPNQWFNNVELVTTENVGLETATYVRNIYDSTPLIRSRLS